MKHISRALALALALLPSIAAAQTFPTLPAQTVIGRLGTPGDTGPSQAIPFSTLGPRLLNNVVTITLPNEGNGGAYRAMNLAGSPKSILTVASNSFATDMTRLRSAGGGISFEKADQSILATLSNAGEFRTTFLTSANEGNNGSFAALNSSGVAKPLLALASTSFGANTTRLRSAANGITFENSSSGILGSVSETGLFTIALPTASSAAGASSTPLALNILSGSSSARTTAINTPTAVISRYEAVTGAAGDGSGGPALFVTTDSTGPVQNNAIVAHSTMTGDADTVALYGAAVQNHPTSIKAAFGGFFTVGAYGANSSGIAIETNVANWTGTNVAYDPALPVAQTFIGIDNVYDGNTGAQFGGVGFLARASRGKWDVGFAAPTGDHIRSTFAQDDSNSVTSFYVHGGSHTDGLRLDGGTYSGCAIKGTGFCLNGSGTITSGVWSGTAIAAASGGTGQTVYAVGDLLYASTTTALSKLADVATGNALISGGVGAAPSWGKIGISTHVSGLGTGIATALGVNTGAAGAPVLFNGAGGTPSSIVLTNATGTASGLTAGNVTTNANLTGDVTSVGNATTLTNAPVIAKVLTGYTSGAGTVSASDSILSAIQKLNGNDALNLPLAGGTMSGAINMGGSDISNVGTVTANTAVSAPLVTTNGAIPGSFEVKLIGANFNSTADQPITIALPTGFTRYRIANVLVSNPSTSLTTAVGGFYTAASKGGIAVVAASQAYSGLTTNTAGSNGSLMGATVTNATTAAYNSSTLYLSLTTPQGSAATADVSIIVNALP